MIEKNNLLVFAIILIVSFSLISSADYQGSFNVNIEGGSIIIDPESCQEDWSGSTWGQCTEEGTQIFICFDKHNCGTDNIKPELCGTIRSCSLCGDGICNNGETCSTCSADCGTCPSGSTGGGGGGGGSSGGSSTTKKSDVLLITSPTNSGNSATCVEDWVCGEWSDSDDICGTRTCTDSNDCGTTDLKPAIVKECPVGFFSTMFSFLTGGVIGASSEESKSSWIGPIILLILIIAGLGILIFRNKKK